MSNYHKLYTPADSAVVFIALTRWFITRRKTAQKPQVVPKKAH
jgi:hypothetical protein